MIPAKSKFPAQVWDGSSPSRQNAHGQLALQTIREPDACDWEQIVNEMRAIQSYALNRQGFAIHSVENKDTWQYAGDFKVVDQMTIEVDLPVDSTVRVDFESFCRAMNQQCYQVLIFKIGLDDDLSPQAKMYYVESGPTHNDAQRFSTHYVFHNVPAGKHTITALASNGGSAQSWEFTDRRLTVMF